MTHMNKHALSIHNTLKSIDTFFNKFNEFQNFDESSFS